MFCKYCGKEIKEGEICTCRQQSSKTPYPKPDIRSESQTADSV